ncbi:unnamed protein product [Haemonchus placei]|uniref:Phlebovirus glycoprotein G2 fusion domain-containing protein n=1 Tax=Haemonchus placei TaxID=6290 RepID=A0A0N4WPQ9_HAEPC|nr:unnamed protein product [Haemonchus placei]
MYPSQTSSTTRFKTDFPFVVHGSHSSRRSMILPQQPLMCQRSRQQNSSFSRKERFNKVVTDVTNSVCRVNNAIAKGCCECPQGAGSKIVCSSEGHPTMASIRCDGTYFTVPCSPGVESTLRLMHTLARLRKICDVNCGSTTTTFKSLEYYIGQERFMDSALDKNDSIQENPCR